MSVSPISCLIKFFLFLIRSHIGFIRDCGVVLKLERFFHLSGRSFGYLSLVLLLSVYSGKVLPEGGLPRYPKRGFEVNAIQSESSIDMRLL